LSQIARKYNRIQKYALYDDVNSDGQSTSVNFAMDPDSEEARNVVVHKLGLTEQQLKQLSQLAQLVVGWNERINLISRRDCSVEVVFGRHILPSLGLLKVTDSSWQPGTKVVDVGTGGGFPGLPLAIALPNVNFLLVDSVGKKLKVVEEIADTLALDNLSTHNGRAEEMAENSPIKHRNAYDVCVGRSVTTIPRFCFWIQDLLKCSKGEGDEGKLMYIIGGDIEREILDQTLADESIEELLGQPGASDKRILVFDQPRVQAIANHSGEVNQQGRTHRGGGVNRQNKKAKGAWTKRDNATPKQRGYDDFQRYG
jgi:16S rRNA (guanine527-N7)-methyltransferase